MQSTELNQKAAMPEAGGHLPLLLRSSQIRPPTFPVTAEFTNWRTEQAAWRDSCALLDQSHHMTDLSPRGPDALRLLRASGTNAFENFVPGSRR